jgi:nucleoid-associated protein YgaU
MKLFQYLLLIGLLTVVSCSRSSKKADSADGSSESMESEADFIVDAEDEDLIIEDKGMASNEEGSSDDMMMEESIASSDSSIELSDEEMTYTVKRGETLMMAAFNIYGDYRKWQSLGSLNGIRGGRVAEGTVIRYKKPVNEFVWNPEGLPYLIKNGDTLVTISSDKYGTSKKWELIYNNNRPLIKDPNLIFAGFTLYYIPERDIASE